MPGTVTAFSGTFKDGYPVDKNTGLVNREWHLCDGTNGTPDLRNRFIYGGDGTNNGTTGGEANVTLTEENIPVHSHTASVSSAGNHYHLMTRNIDLTVTNPNGINPSWDTVNDFDGSHTYKTSEAGDHTHTVTIGNTGGNQPHNNMPPYYVLAYIMKL